MPLLSRVYIRLLLTLSTLGMGLISLGSQAAALPVGEYDLLERKQALIGTMVQPGPTLQRIEESANPQAVAQLKQAQQLHQQANQWLTAGDMTQAKESSNQALLAITSALALARQTSGPSPADRKRYQVLSDGLASLEKSMHANADITIERAKFSSLKQQAERLQQANDYRQANNMLVQAYEMAALAVSTANQQKTVVVSLDFATPKDEYDYEDRRYQGNRDLVEVMLKRQADSPTYPLVRQGMGRADKTRQQAHIQVSNGEYTQAITTMEQASEQLSKAMGMLGIQF